MCSNGKTRILQQFLTEHPVPEASLSFVDDELPRGAGGCLRDAAGQLGDGPFLVLEGRLFIEGDLSELADEHASSGAALTVGVVPAANWSCGEGERALAPTMLKREPTDAKNAPRLKVELARFHKAKGEVEKAKQVYDEVLKESNESIEMKLLAVDLFEEAQPEVVEKRLQEIAAKAPGKEAAAAREALASLYLRRDQREKAVEQFKAIAKADSENAAVRRTLFRMMLDAGERDKAKGFLDEIMRIEGSEPSTAVCDWAEYEILSNGPKAPLETYLKVQEKLEKVCQSTPSARAFIILGDANRLGGRLSEAIRCYQRALQANPRMATVGAVLIGALNEAGRQQEADLELERLAKIAPSSTIVLDLQFDRLRREGGLDGAITVKKRQLDFQPDAGGLIEYAQLLRVKNDVAGAEAALREACKLAPDSPAAVSALASFLRGTERQAEGRKHCDEFVAAHKDKKAAFFTRAQYCRTSGEPTKASDDLRAVLKLDPKDKNAIIALGDISWESGDLKEAMSHYRKAAAMEPPESYARRNLVERLVATGKRPDFDEAQGMAQKLIREEDKRGALADPDIFLLKASLDMQSRETVEQAKKHCRRAMEIAPNLAAPHIMMSLITQAQGDLTKASEEASRALAIEPRSARAIMLSVEVLKRERRFREASVLVDRLPQDSPALALTRADLLAAESGAASAANALSKTIAGLKPDAPASLKVALLLRLARHLEESGDVQQAGTQLRAARQPRPEEHCRSRTPRQ